MDKKRNSVWSTAAAGVWPWAAIMAGVCAWAWWLPLSPVWITVLLSCWIWWAIIPLAMASAERRL